MTNRRDFIAFAGCVAGSWPFMALAQQAPKIPRLGYMSLQSRASEDSRLEAFRLGLRELGYVEGKNIAIEYRHADGNSARLPDIAAELVRLKVDILIAGSNSVAAAAHQATRTIPIVFPVHGDPVGSGLVANLARPGGNITGLTSLALEISGKRLELLKETIPRLSRVTVLSNPKNQAHGSAVNDLRAAAVSLGIQLQPVEIGAPDELERALSAIAKMRMQALMALPDAMLNTLRVRIAAFAAKNRLPTMFTNADWADAGGLLSYGTDIPDLFRRAAIYVDKIIRGAKPAELPVEQAQKFELVINLKTAGQIGLLIPPNVLARADRVIE